MIEIVHFKNRYGKAMAAVFDLGRNTVWYSPASKEYAERYAAGLERPYYPLPAVATNYVCLFGFEQPSGCSVPCNHYNLPQCRNCAVFQHGKDYPKWWDTWYGGSNV